MAPPPGPHGLALVVSERARGSLVRRQLCAQSGRDRASRLRLCHATFMTDPVAVHNRSITGVERLLWGNDYPHHEGTWPHSVGAVREQFAPVAHDDVLAMVAGNAARVFGFDVSMLPVLAGA